MVVLRPMSPEEFDRFRAWSEENYAEQNVAAGSWNAEGARERSRGEFAKLLPQGLTTPDHHLFVVVDEASGTRVGEVWYQIQRDAGRPQLFVYWVGIDEPYRRHGHASGTLRQLESKARESGAWRVALHVFGSNTAAQALYARLGFLPTNVLMAKRLDSG